MWLDSQSMWSVCVDVSVLLMVQLERVWDGDLEFVLSFAVQVNPNAGHCEGVSGLGLIDVRHWNALHTKIKPF